MRNIALVIAYDGTNYHGWQCQPNAVTVEETLREKTAKILNHSVSCGPRLGPTAESTP